jgi:hypothetical protein
MRRKTLARKREQVSKVAETDPFMAPTWKTPTRGQVASPVILNPENAVYTTPMIYIFLTPV